MAKDIKTNINTIQILKKGCIKFEDCYNKDNIVKTISISNEPWEVFDKNSAKNEIIATVLKIWNKQ